MGFHYCNVHPNVRYEDYGECPACRIEYEREDAIYAQTQAIQAADQRAAAAAREAAQREEESLEELKRRRAEADPAHQRRAEFDVCVQNAWGCLEYDQLDDAEEQIRQAAALLPVEPELFDVRAEWAHRTGDAALWQKSVENAFRCQPTRKRGFRVLRDLAPEVALDWIDDMAQRWSDDRSVRYRQAVTLAQLPGHGARAAESLIALPVPSGELKKLLNSLVERLGEGAEVAIARDRIEQEIRARAAAEAIQETEAEARQLAAETARQQREEEARVEAEAAAQRAAAEREKAEAQEKRKRDVDRAKRVAAAAAAAATAAEKRRREQRLPWLAVGSGVPGLVAAALVFNEMANSSDMAETMMAIMVGTPLACCLAGVMMGTFAVEVEAFRGGAILGALIGSVVGSFLFIGCGGGAIQLATDGAWVEPTVMTLAWVFSGFAGFAAAAE